MTVLAGASEAMIGMSWITATIKADTTLTSLVPSGSFRSLAPVGTVPPYIIIAWMSGTDTTTANAYRLFADMQYQIKVVGPAKNTSVLYQAAARLDVLFGGPGAGTTNDGYVLSCNRQSPLEMDELVNGDLWTNIGGLYRLIVQKYA